jgi:hypothetical protein
MRPENRRVLSADDAESRLVEIEKSAELAGHSPNPDAVDRARRILNEETSPDEARAELVAKYADGARV